MSSKLFKKIFYNILLLIVVYLVLMFTFLVPYIERNVTDLEEQIGKIQLEKTAEIIRSAQLEMETYAASALARHKESLVRLTSIAKQIISFQEKHSRGLSTKDIDKAQHEALDMLSQFTYNQDDYFYVSDYRSVLLAHPYLRGKDFSQIRDEDGKLIVPSLVKTARKNGHGFVEYKWKKNRSSDTPYHKLTYAEDFKPWSWIIGTGVYIDDIEKEITHRKARLIERLRRILARTYIGKNGYVYIFDSDAKMIIHPDKHWEGRYFHDALNPQTGHRIFDDLIWAYHHGDKTMRYLWDAPGDRGHYVYPKISWIEYNAYFDWYICSSAYPEDFHHYSRSLKKILLYAIPLIALIIAIMGFCCLRKLLSPIIALAETAKQVSRGDWHVRYRGETNTKEIAILAKQFNTMLDTIHRQVETLDSKVQEKTQELTNSLQEKEILLKEIHHRVKNNLYTISSILGLQEFQEKKITKEELIASMQQRIQAIAIAHEMLSHDNKKYSNIAMQTYIKELVKSLNTAISKPAAHSIICEIDSVELSIEEALLVGLIINELVTNSLKYAFGDTPGEILVSMQIQDQETISLCVQDDGCGIDLSQPRGTGLDMVELLAAQLGGEMKISTNKGTKITIDFAPQSSK